LPPEEVLEPSGGEVTIGNETSDGRDLLLVDYTVGGVTIEKAGGKWADYQLGRLGFDGENWNFWNATS
jgi:hypothetical protein